MSTGQCLKAFSGRMERVGSLTPTLLFSSNLGASIIEALLKSLRPPTLFLYMMGILFASFEARADSTGLLFAADEILVDRGTNTIHLWNVTTPFTVGLMFDHDSVTREQAADISGALSDLLKDIELSTGISGAYRVGKATSSIYIIVSRLPLNTANKYMLALISLISPWRLDSSDPLTNLARNCYAQLITVDRPGVPTPLGGVGGFLYVTLEGGVEGVKECMSRRLPQFLGIRSDIPENVFLGFNGHGAAVGLHDLEKTLLDLLYKTPGVTPEMPRRDFLDVIKKRLSSSTKVQ